MAFAYRGKNINILNAYKHNTRKPFISNTVFGVTSILLSFIIILLGAYSYIGYRIISTNKEMDSLKEYTENADNLALYEQALESIKEITDLKAKRAGLLEAEKVLNSIPLLEKRDLQRFLSSRGANIHISNIVCSRDAKTLSFDASTSSFMNISGYIRRLQQTGIFSAIEYNGYHKEDQQNYGFSVTCHLKAVVE